MTYSDLPAHIRACPHTNKKKVLCPLKCGKELKPSDRTTHYDVCSRVKITCPECLQTFER